MDAVGSRVMAQLAARQPVAEADVKALEAKIGEKLEITAQAGDLRPQRRSSMLWMKSPRQPPCPQLPLPQ